MKVPYLRSKHLSIKIMLTLPTIMEFDNLHLTENLSNAVKSIKGSSGLSTFIVFSIRILDRCISAHRQTLVHDLQIIFKWQFKCALAVCSG